MKGPRKVPAFLATWLRVKPQFARQDGLKHGTMPQRSFWWGWVCFNGGPGEWLKHGTMPQRLFWWGWVCFNGGGGTKKAGVKAGFGGSGRYWIRTSDPLLVRQML